MLATFGLLIGIASSVYSLRARVSVSTGEVLNPLNPFNTILTVSNDGPLPISDVSIHCGMSIAIPQKSPTPIPD